jgi:cytoskeletal protein RodZ
VFEIGNSLREARVRRGVDYAEAEAVIKIRGKYLRALEDEQFDILPAETYVKGFLRSYADYLGLDGQLYVDEFNSRFVTGDDHELRPQRTRRGSAQARRTHRRAETRIVVAALAAVAVLTVVVVVISAWTSGGKSPAPKGPAAAGRAPQVTPPLLAVTPLTGSTHLTVHDTSATGRLRFDGTVEKGDRPLGIRGKRLWVQLDAPENVQLAVRGHLVHVPGSRPRVIIVTSTGWRPARA